MRIHEPIIINNRSFSKDELEKHALEAKDDHSRPDWERELYQFLHDFLNTQTPLIQKTSGTTGDPKRIPLERDAMVQSAKMTLEHFSLKPGMRALLCLPVSYIAGKMMVVRALVGGLALVARKPSGNPLEDPGTGNDPANLKGPGEGNDLAINKDPEALNDPADLKDPGSGNDPAAAKDNDATKDHSATFDFAAMVPMQVFEAIKDGTDLSLINTLIIGGGEISPDLRRDIRSLKNISIFETFAMSETYSHFAVKKLNGNNPDRFFNTLPGVQIETDPRGCLVVSVPGITASPVVTNDLVEIEDERSFRWLGRIDNRISSGGIKIIPELIEARLREKLPFEAVILGIPDKKLGQKLVLAVEVEDRDLLPPDFSEWMNQNLQKHEIPKEIRCLPRFPRNSSQKILRQEISAGL